MKQTKDEYFCVCGREKSVIVCRFKDSKLSSIPMPEALRLADQGRIRGYVGCRFMQCLYYRGRFYVDYYLNDGFVFKWGKGGCYTPLTARRRLPMCNIYCDDDIVILAGLDGKHACLTELFMFRDGFTGLLFSSLVFRQKLFLHAQTFKVYPNGEYFVNNKVFILNADLSLYPVFSTNLSLVRRMERKVSLHMGKNNPEYGKHDQFLIDTELHLFVLLKKQNGVYLDDRCIFRPDERHF